MRNKLMIALFILFGCSLTQAQNLKIGYVDSRGVSEQLPEVKAAYTQLGEFQKKKQQDLQKKAEAFRQKVKDAEDEAAKGTMSEQMRAAKQRELEAGQEQLQIEQNSMQTEVATREKQLFEPIEKRIQAAITEVANENGYTYVLAKEVLLHSPAGEDISNLVVKKLLASAPKTNTPVNNNTGANNANQGGAAQSSAGATTNAGGTKAGGTKKQ
jgi:outer membrane protein